MTEATATPTEHPAHPPYIGIWVALVLLLAASLGFGILENPVVVAVLVFAIASVKAFMVAYYYMDMRSEPLWITLIILCGLAVLLVLFFGLMPDILYQYGN